MAVAELERRTEQARCACGACRSCWSRAARTEARAQGRPWGVRWDFWTREEEDRLRQLAGTVELHRVAEILTAEFGTPRTRNAVDVRCARLGISHWVKGMSMTELERLFGYDHRAIARNFVDTGLLPARRWSGRGPNEGWWFEPADVERFIRSYPWLYDWTKMQRGHRLTRIAEMAHRIDPWVTMDVVARHLCLHPAPAKKWLHWGLIPHKRRPVGGGGQVVVRARDLPAIKAAIDTERVRRAEAGKQRAREKRMAHLTADGPWLSAILFQCRACGRLIAREDKSRERGRVVQRRRLVCERCRKRARRKEQLT